MPRIQDSFDSYTFLPIMNGSRNELLGVIVFDGAVPDDDLVYDILEDISERGMGASAKLEQLMIQLRSRGYSVSELPLEEDIFI